MKLYQIQSACVGLIVAVGLVSASTAHARPAHCGDVRKISRSTIADTVIDACSDPAQRDGLGKEALDSATQYALERLAKFDGECDSIKGTAVETANVPQEHVGPTWHYSPEVECFGGAHGYTECVTVQRPDYQICEAQATSTITHKCECN